MTVGEVLELPADELSYWQIFHEIDHRGIPAMRKEFEKPTTIPVEESIRRFKAVWGNHDVTKTDN